MANIVDMHVHTTNSPDAELSEEELARRAVEAGLGGVGFVAHVDFHPKDFCSGYFSPDRYDGAFEEARRAFPGLRILKGLEIGEPHRYEQQARELVQGRRYDFVTGGLHWVGDRMVLDAGGFEGTDPRTLVEEYYRQLLQMASSCGMEILAHVGIFRRGLAKAGLDTSLDETALWPGLLAELLTAMIDRGIALEVNTSGLRRPELVTYPTARVLRMYGSLGGRLVTLGSDTHSDPWVFYGLEEGAGLLRSCGFESVCYFEGGEPVPVPLV